MYVTSQRSEGGWKKSEFECNTRAKEGQAVQADKAPPTSFRTRLARTIYIHGVCTVLMAGK